MTSKIRKEYEKLTGKEAIIRYKLEHFVDSQFNTEYVRWLEHNLMLLRSTLISPEGK